MFGKKLVLTISLAAMAPLGFATPVTLTNTSYGVVSESTLDQHPDIPVGAAFELTTVARYDTKDIVLGTGNWWDSREWVHADVTVTLKVGGENVVFASDYWGGANYHRYL